MRLALSGLSGCGNSTVTGLVASKLGLKKINYTFRELAREQGKTFEEVCAEAEETFPAVDLLLDKKLFGLAAASEDCVVGSRLAVWLDDERVTKRLGVEKSFSFDARFWLNVSLEERARRIAEREGLEPEKTLKETRERDERDWKRYKRLYGINILEHEMKGVNAIGAEVIAIDAEYNDAEGVAREIASAVKKAKSLQK